VGKCEFGDVEPLDAFFAVDKDGTRRFEIGSEGVGGSGWQVEGTWEIHGSEVLLSITFQSNPPIRAEDGVQETATLWYDDSGDIQNPLLYLKIEPRWIWDFGFGRTWLLRRFNAPENTLGQWNGTPVVTMSRSAKAMANVKVRKGPGTSFAETSTGVSYSDAYGAGQAWNFIPSGRSVQIAARSIERAMAGGLTDYWYLCRFTESFHGGNEYGWVFGGFLSLEGPPIAEDAHRIDPVQFIRTLDLRIERMEWEFLDGNPGVAVVGVNRGGKVTTAVKLRKKPSTTAPVVQYFARARNERLDFVPVGEKVFVLSRTSDKVRVGDWNNYWYFVRYSDPGYGDGRTAWAYAEFIALDVPGK
jgi:hypothetical protein